MDRQRKTERTRTNSVDTTPLRPTESHAHEGVGSHNRILTAQRLLGNRAVSATMIQRVQFTLDDFYGGNPNVIRLRKVDDDWIGSYQHKAYLIKKLSDVSWDALYPDGRSAVDEFAFEELTNDGRMWLSAAFIKGDSQGRGIGKMIMKAAVEEYGAVFASTASQQEHDDHDDQDCFLTEGGAALVQSCITAGIMQDDWRTHPWNGGIDEASDYEEDNPD